MGIRIDLEPEGSLGSYGLREAGGGGDDLRPVDGLDVTGATSSLARRECEWLGSGDQLVGGGGRDEDAPELLLLPRGWGRSPGSARLCDPGDADMVGERRGAW